ncbi:hypothetical protein [Rhodobaculum claviforme]|uniref:VPLPA-CTERM protein sorting domain-containing protein n=1 Tax=Rhodobaculum claviforme TaxID=1549854 RepID=A0A934TMH3_9RHOB|nr:hypothetical protein [Rhodobaculum claviforme]MBK5927882.1 hypothetical protein [Rhodobaculum claviforme]
MTFNRTTMPTSTPLRRGLGAMAGLMMGLSALPAMAASCETTQVEFTVTQGDASIKGFCDSGNDSWNDTTEVFSLTGWVTAQKVEDGAAGPQGGTVPSFDAAPVSRGDGTWSISNPGAYADLVLVLKQASGFGAFRLDAGQALSGSWSTEGPGGSVGVLSHATLWYRPDGARIEIGLPGGDVCCPCGGVQTFSLLSTTSDCDVDDTGPIVRDDEVFPGTGGEGVGVVPLPAAGWMLLGGMGLLGGLGWRRSRRA